MTDEELLTALLNIRNKLDLSRDVVVLHRAISRIQRCSELETRVKYLLERVHELEDESVIWEKTSLVALLHDNERLEARMEKLKEWCEAWLNWSPPPFDGNDTGRMWRTHQSRVLFRAFKEALNGKMQLPEESHETHERRSCGKDRDFYKYSC